MTHHHATDQKGTRVSNAHTSARKPLLRRSGVAGVVSEGGFGGSGAPAVRFLATLALASAIFLGITTTSAFALQTHVSKEAFGSEGSGAGQLLLRGAQSVQSGVAINDTSGDVYVADTGNHRVDQFSSAGVFIRAWGWGVRDGSSELQVCTAATTCQAGLAGTSPGQFETPVPIAIDNSGGLSHGDVYVGDSAHNVITKFDSEGHLISSWGSGGQLNGSTATDGPFETLAGLVVGSSGDLNVLTRNSFLFRFAQDGSFVGDFSVANPTFPTGLALDPAGNIFKVNSTGAAEELDPTGAALGRVSISPQGEGLDNTGLAVDSSTGILYAAAEFFFKANRQPQIDEYAFNGSGEVSLQPSGTCPIVPAGGCEPTSAFGLGEIGATAGIAVNSSTHLVYAADSKANRLLVFTQVVLPDVNTEAVTEVKPHSAILNGKVNPAGGGVATCQFAWGTTTALSKTPIPCESSIPDGNSPVSVHVAALELLPDTTYFYRLEASNTQGTNRGLAGETKEFTTSGPGIHASSVIEVSAVSAALQATIDPHGVPTKYLFEYGPDSSYGSTVPAPPGLAIGSGQGDREVTQRILGLTPATTYHYRVTVLSEVEPGLIEEFTGPDHAFTTQGAGSSAPADSRQWQLVSPPDKHDGSIRNSSNVGIATMQAAEDGRAITYSSNAPLEAGATSYPNTSQTLSSRGPEGWSSRILSISHNQHTGTGLVGTEYRFFSPQLASGILQPYGPFDPGLSAEASEATPYLLSLQSCGSSCYRPLVTAKSGFENALPGFGGNAEGQSSCAAGSEVGDQRLCGPEFVAATPDLSHVVIESSAPLVSGAPVGETETNGEYGGLYEWSAGTISLVGVLPNGEPTPPGKTSLGFEVNGQSRPFGPAGTYGTGRNAISNNGRVFFTVDPGHPHLYMRDTTVDQTVQIASPEPGCGTCGSGGGFYKIASADGSRVYFTAETKLTANAHKGGSGAHGSGDLYQCKIVENAGQLACQLTDLTPESSGEGANVEGSVLGASEDGTAVYFVANGTLAAAPNTRGESPVRGDPNLFEWHEGNGITFIATLAGKDNKVWENQLINQAARVSSDGRWVTFMSEHSLTGYDSRDAISGEPDAEVYLYDSSSKRLICVSCDPTGARPVGIEFSNAISGNGNGNAEGIAVGRNWDPEGWVAATLPQSNFLYQPRYLSDSGRLFFNTLSALDPSDSNSNWDVYEYEPPGVGGCSESSSTFDQGTEGCVGLISAGTSGHESGFLDASASGADAFFLTYSRLATSDLDSTPDVYDAHECSAEVPCFPPPVPATPACEGDACQQPATPPLDPTPGSLSFNGAGNVHETQSKKKAVKKKRHKHKKSSKSHKRSANNHRRAGR